MVSGLGVLWPHCQGRVTVSQEHQVTPAWSLQTCPDVLASLPRSDHPM